MAMLQKKIRTLFLTGSALVIANSMWALPTVAKAQTPPPDMAQMWALIQKQQAQITALQDALAKTESQKNAPETTPVIKTPAASAPALETVLHRLDQQDRKIEATSGLLEDSLHNNGVGGQGWWNDTTLGGYGEMHYNGGKKNEIDFHRFVLFAGHRFNDWIRLSSELEVEHVIASSNASDAGEVEVEQAFIEMDLTKGAGLRFGQNDTHRLKAGLFLVPVGILNETHEPPTFYGVERNGVEKNIIPATWWEGGADLNGTFGAGFSYDLAVHSGLDVGTDFKIRGGRQETSEANANNGAITARLRWSGIPGVTLSATGQYQGDVTQGRQNIAATLLEGHAVIEKNGFGLRALYAQWNLDKAPGVVALGRNKQYGWYVEPSYKFATQAGTFGVFGRYEEWDTQAALKSADTRFAVTTLGLNYWVHPDVVFKIDYQLDNPPAGIADDDRINLGVGYQF